MEDNISAFVSRQLHATYDKSEWLVSFQQAVKSLTESQAKEKIHDNLPTIFEIVTHFTYWNEWHLRRIQGKRKEETITDNRQTFTENNLASWNELYSKTCSVFEEWLIALETLSEKEIPLIQNLIIHNAYHIGQIVFIRKLQNSWNNEDGVS
ncbi:MAG TPA: hypothetical protein VGB95_03510 [Chitinophagales bacterium]